MRQLLVFVNDQHAGSITEMQPGRGYVFCYEPDYLRSDGGPVSLTLPKREDPYRSEHLFPFFTNLLPEGANRKAVCRHARIDEDDFFGMLMATVGTDMIGAVNFRMSDGTTKKIIVK